MPLVSVEDAVEWGAQRLAIRRVGWCVERVEHGHEHPFLVGQVVFQYCGDACHLALDPEAIGRVVGFLQEFLDPVEHRVEELMVAHERVEGVAELWGVAAEDSEGAVVFAEVMPPEGATERQARVAQVRESSAIVEGRFE